MSARGRRLIGIAPDALERAIKEGKAHRFDDDDLSYVAVTDDFHTVPRGTVVLGERVIPTYPKIARIFALGTGLRRNFSEPVHVEEKIDGYNIRIALAGDRLLALTRSGRACPFTEDRLPDLGRFDGFFSDHPDLVLCGEVAGPENPYIHEVSARVTSDVAFFAFDVMQAGAHGFLPIDEREALFARYAIPRAPYLGVFGPEELPRLEMELRRLHREGAEGIVIKPDADGLRVKYVTPSINVADLASESRLLGELPGEFFSSRLLRLAMSRRELGLRADQEQLERDIGRALLSGVEATLEEIAERGEVSIELSLRFRQERNIDRLLAHVNHSSKRVRLQVLSRGRSGDHHTVRLRKVFHVSTDSLRNLLAGVYVFD